MAGRPLLLIGSAGMTVALATMAIAFTRSSGTGDNVSLPSPWGTIALAAANAFVVLFGRPGVRWSRCCRERCSPTGSVRSPSGWPPAHGGIANLLIMVTFPPLLDTFGATGPYLMYAVFAQPSFVFVLGKVPETKGVELEDMSDEVPSRARRARR